MICTKTRRNLVCLAVGIGLTSIFLQTNLQPAKAHGDDDGHSDLVADEIYGPNDRPTLLEYSVDSSTEFNPYYDRVRKAMAPIYKGTRRDDKSKDYSSPIIGSTQIDLNGDNVPEIISYHVPDADEAKKICDAKGLCPFFVTDFSGNAPRSLGTIYARTVDRGDDIQKGYWTLKVYDDPKSLENFTLYSFDPLKKKYVPTPGGGK